MARLTRRSLTLSAARIVVICEYFARVLWAPVSIVALFVGIAGLDILPSLNRWVHAAVVTLFAAWIAASLRRSLQSHRWPRRVDILRRLERDNKLSHRPLDALEDRPFIRNKDSRGLWALYQSRLASQTKKLRIGLPSPNLAFHDIRAVRTISLLILAIGLFAARGHIGERLDAALSPEVLGETSPRSISFNLWIKPPEYTGVAPIVFSDSAKDKGAIEIPAGSTVEAHVSGGTRRPHLVIDGQRKKFQAIDRTNFEIEASLPPLKRLALTQGWRTLGSWDISVVDTIAPVINWVSAPAANDRNEVKLDYTIADQYGLAKLEAHIELAEEVRAQMLPRGSALDTPDAAIVTVDLPLSGHPKSLKKNTPEDLTANRWAGFPVHISLTATSVDGLSTTTSAQDLILPERVFNNPTAKVIVAQRKKLILDPVGERLSVAGKIAQLSVHPENLNNDSTVFLVLRSAATRLWRDPSLADFGNIENMLWQSAVRLENGINPEADKSLAAAEAALKKALEQGAAPAEISRLTENLRQALNHALDQMEKSLAEKLARGEAVPIAPPGMQAMNRNDLNSLIDKLKSLGEKGDTEGAKQALSQLQQTMQNLKDAQSKPPDPKAMEAMKVLQQLRELIDRQQALMDKTYRRSRGNVDAGDEFNHFDRDPFDPRRRHRANSEDTGADDQLHLRSDLEGLHKQMDGLAMKTPPGIGDAEKDMGSSAQSLNDRQFAEALPQQQDALDKLRQSQQEMSKEIAKGGGGSGMMMGSGGAPGGGGNGEPRDPLGRSLNGNNADENIPIPDQDDQQRSRAVIEELRKRAGDRTRSKAEHSYIEDLLKMF